MHPVNSSHMERVQEALERAASLPPEQQARVAADILSVIDNALWDAQLRNPANEAAHEGLIAEALAKGHFQPFPSAEELGVEDPSADETDDRAADERA
jgi:hypothetical protein